MPPKKKTAGTQPSSSSSSSSSQAVARQGTDARNVQKYPQRNGAVNSPKKTGASTGKSPAGKLSRKNGMFATAAGSNAKDAKQRRLLPVIKRPANGQPNYNQGNAPQVNPATSAAVSANQSFTFQPQQSVRADPTVEDEETTKAFHSYLDALKSCYANHHAKPAHPGPNASKEQIDEYKREFAQWEETQLRIQTNEAIVQSQQEQERKAKQDREREESLKFIGQLRPHFEEKGNYMLKNCQTLSNLVHFFDKSDDSEEFLGRYPQHRINPTSARPSTKHLFYQDAKPEDVKKEFQEKQQAIITSFRQSRAANSCSTCTAEIENVLHDSQEWPNDFSKKIGELRKAIVDVMVMTDRVVHWYPKWGVAYAKYLSTKIDEFVGECVDSNRIIQFLREEHDKAINAVFITPPAKAGSIPDLLTNIPDNYKPKVEEDPDIIEIIDTPTHSHKGTEVQVEL